MEIRYGDFSVRWTGNAIEAKVKGEEGKEMTVNVSLPKEAADGVKKIICDARNLLDSIERDFGK